MNKIILSLSILLACIISASAQNSVSFDNQSGEPALVKLIGPTSTEIEVPDATKQTVQASAGKYFIKVRYGIQGKYHYTKGQEFTVDQTATTTSEITITLHKVINGNYGSSPINEQDFDVGKPSNTAINGDTKDKDLRLLAQTTNLKTAPAGMILIPAGAFTMGDNLDGDELMFGRRINGDATPTISVTVSAFYMDSNLVGYSQWQSIYDWGTKHGYGFVHAGSGKAANHPVHTVDWYDAVKWCNARAQQAGLTPVYYTDAGLMLVYTNGEVDAIYANWTATGYRLPTEAEWEKAARGGLNGQRFPWGNTISENQANYFSNDETTYDLGPHGFNAGFATGEKPYTSPVGSFAANGYGLYDMAGNVSEWCWDWYGAPYAGGSDPRGPASSPDHCGVLRGGSWSSYAAIPRCADRWKRKRSIAADEAGFRCVMGH